MSRVSKLDSSSASPVTPGAPRRTRLGSAVGRWLSDWSAAFRHLVAFTTVTSVAMVALDGFITPFLREQGVDVVAIGFFHGLAGAAGAFGAALGGIFADRWGRRVVLAVGRTLRFGGWAIVLLAPRSPYITLAAVVLGLGYAGGTAVMTLLAETAPKGRRAFAFAVVGAIDGLVSMVVPVTIGFLADRYGLGAALGLAYIPAVAGLLLITRLQETLATPAPSEGTPVDPPVAGTPASRPSLWAGLRYLLSGPGRGAALMALVWLVTGVEMGFMRPIYPLYVLDRFGLSYAGLGLVATVGSIGVVLGQLVGGYLADRIGHARLMVVCLSSTGLAFLVIPLATTPSGYAVLLSLAYFSGCLAGPCWGAVGANATPRVVRGAVTGLFTAFRSVGLAVGGAFSGLVYAQGITLPWYVVAAGEGVMLLLVLVGIRWALPGFGGDKVYDD